MRSWLVRSAVVVCPLVLAASGAASPGTDFCDDFSAVVDASADGFAPLRGERLTSHVDPINDMRVVWQCLKALPGADRCQVEWARQQFVFEVLWLGPNLEAHEKTFSAVRQLVADCGAGENEVSKSGQSVWFKDPGRPDLDVVLTYNANRVRLSFSVVGFQQPPAD